MWSENEPRATKVGNGPFLAIGVMFVVLIIVASCVFSVISLKSQKEPRPTPTQEILMVSISAAMPAIYFSIRLPVLLSGSVSVPVPVSVSASVSEQIWKVTKIKSLGYELDGRRSDLAIFKRVDSEDTVKAYCINRGWDTPDIGTEYLLNTEGIFVPLYDRADHSFQRFQMIQ
jgi:hypothetical protein